MSSRITLVYNPPFMKIKNHGSPRFSQTYASQTTDCSHRLLNENPGKSFFSPAVILSKLIFICFFSLTLVMEKKHLKIALKQSRHFLKITLCPPFYVYAYEHGFSVPYRFRFNCTQKRQMKRLITGLKRRNFSVKIWRPKNGS